VPGIEVVDLAINVSARRSLIISDIHVGHEAEMIRGGTLLPKTHFNDISKRLQRIFEELSINKETPYERLIINGDLSHQFGYLTWQESQESFELLKFIYGLFKEVILIEGNHDGNLKPLLGFEGQELLVGSSFELDSILFLHGDTEPEDLSEEISTVVIGHEHPAVGFRDPVTSRVEQYKSYMLGKYEGKTLIVQPSFNPLAQGSDLTRERTLSPLLNDKTVLDFEIFSISDEGDCFAFGLLRSLVAENGKISGGNVG
jgi:hypothetical protein